MATKDYDSGYIGDGQWRWVNSSMPDWYIGDAQWRTIEPGEAVNVPFGTRIPLREASSCPQGWQCPACKVVYSPSVERCTCQASEKMRLGL